MSHRVEIEGYPPFEAEEGESLLVACENAGVPMDCACGGFAACNSCRVVVLQGAEMLNPIDEEEAGFLDHPGQRLGCQIEIAGPLSARLDPGC